MNDMDDSLAALLVLGEREFPGTFVGRAVHLAVRSALKHAVTAVTAINFCAGVSRYNDLFMAQSILSSRQAILTY